MEFFADELPVANPVDSVMLRARGVRGGCIACRIEESPGGVTGGVVVAQGVCERLQPSTGRFVHVPQPCLEVSAV